MSPSSGRVFRACAPLVVVGLLPAALAAAPQDPQDQQPPTFRTGINIVRVDVYPTRDGRIVEGLTAADFEVLEDGALQKIETFEFVRFPQSNPVGERRDPNSQREGFQLAADPSYRVFVIYLDNLHVDFAGSHSVRAPLIHFLNRVLGPKDLFGVLTTRHGMNDLMLGQKTDFIEEQLTKYWDWGRGARVLEDPQDQVIHQCFPANQALIAELVRRRRIDTVFTGLEQLASRLGGLREERTNILLVSGGWSLPGRAAWVQAAERPRIGGPGVTNAGKLTFGKTHPGGLDPHVCEDFRLRLGDIDFQQRLRDLLQLARESNVTFYAINPFGLVAWPYDDRNRVDSLLTLTNNTDGIAVVNTNNLSAGAARIAEDLAAAYYLGYSPTNTKADGRVRRITVRLKSTGEKLRARREYRAPVEEDLAAMRAAAAAADAAPAAPNPADEALAELKRLRPGAVLHTRGAVLGDELVVTTELTAPEVEAGRWKQGGPLQVMVTDGNGDTLTMTSGRIEPGQRAAVIRIALKQAPGPFSAAIRLRSSTGGNAEDGISVARPSGLLGDPLVFRLATPNAPRPAGSVQFRRTERLQVRWPVEGGAVDRPGVRVLGRDGVPLELKAALSQREEGGIHFLVADLNLAALTAGEYLLEITGARGEVSDSALLAFRVSR